MDLRKAYLSMIKSFNGGWDAIAPALGMTRSSLENRIYERKGQSILVETAIQMQAFSGTKFFAEAIATTSGGVFVKLFEGEDVDDELLHLKFQKLYAGLGRLSQSYTDATADGEIDKRERKELNAIAEEIHKTIQEMMSLMFKVYCRAENSSDDK
ncbi:YmfL family putative regulatory protein [Glaciimonas sp. PAMC28666]|uniref:YmfL family putative regulatory protein n=1 Tax=Glaciimonas sp. PAMC28666 TaxID=2807626 RepID=UPI00272D1751|nr:YmfL family putative regulatory protein [Glaciimonas sp. PAMC28666]